MLNAELVAAVVLNLEFQKLDRDGLGEGVTGLFLNCGFDTYCYTVSFQSFHSKNCFKIHMKVQRYNSKILNYNDNDLLQKPPELNRIFKQTFYAI